MSTKEQYWKYSLITIILVMGVVIFFKATPFLGGLLGAATIYILLRNQMLYLIEKKHMKKSLMATLMLIETILIFLIPISLVVWLLISKLQAINLDPESLMEPIGHVSKLVQEKTGYDVLSKGNINALLSVLPKVGQILMGSISNFIINVLVLILVLYFMLVGGRKMEDYIIDILPFNQRNKRDVLHEFHMVVKSNAIGVPLLAVIQGGIAMLGYYIFGAPEVILWGVVSCFATDYPGDWRGYRMDSVGLYIGATGHWWMALGLSVYCIVIVANVDNLIRSVLQRKMADTSPDYHFRGGYRLILIWFYGDYFRTFVAFYLCLMCSDL
ncbi:MAG: AI-2E family transporter [Odoribacter splanchnicus]